MLVYWIHKNEHTDPLTEGYVGITNNLPRRLLEHKQTTGTILFGVFKKYQDIKITILEENISLEQAIQTEIEYRPGYRIGWNICPGGGVPPNDRENHHNKGRVVTEESRIKMSLAKRGTRHPNFGKPLSEETKKKISEAQRGKLNHRFGKTNSPESNTQRSKTLSGIPKERITCPHCGHIGGKPAMVRFHLSNCKRKAQ